MPEVVDVRGGTIQRQYVASRTCSDFHNDDSFVRGLMGPLGSGKSTACVIELMRRAYLQEPGPQGIKRSRFAVVRNTYRELADSTVRTFHDWVPPTPGFPRRWRGNDMNYHIVEGNLDIEILFRALNRPDDVKKLLSTEYTGAWINEAREVDLSVITGTKGGLSGRVGRFPPAREEGCTWSGIIMDSNPPDQDHWWFRMFEEMRPNGWRLFKQPGARSPQAENLANLPSTYYDRMMQGAKPEWIAVYVDGEYGFVIEGKPVYEADYLDSIHCAREPFGPIPGIPIFVGVDFGLTPAAVFGQIHPRGHWLIFDEMIGDGIGIARFSEEIRKHLRQDYPDFEVSIWGDPAGTARAQTDEKTCFEIMASEGLDAKPADTNNLTMRLEAVRQALQRVGFALSPKCTILRKGFLGGYSYRRVKVAGEERYHDEPDKNRYSHPHDALQYLILGAGGGRYGLFPKAQQRDAREVPDWLQRILTPKRSRGGWMGA